MKKILSLGLLFLSSALFSMELDIVRQQQTVNVKPVLRSIATIKKAAHIPNRLEEVELLYKVDSAFIPNRLGEVELFHGNRGFCVFKNDEAKMIRKCDTDKMVRDLTKDQLKAFLAIGYVSLNKMDNGEYSLKANGRINGGGPIGASIGAFLGKAVVYVVGHGAIQIVAICTGPAYPVTVLALEGCLAIPIETASMAGAVAGGMIGAVATGPV